MDGITSLFGTTVLQMPLWLDLLGLIVGSVFGGLTAAERKLDVVGAMGLAMLCGMGGGLIRDMIMQVGNVYMLSTPYAIPASITAGLLGYLFLRGFRHFPNSMEWLDMVAISLFAAAGADKAMLYGLGGWACVLMGTMTAVGGGMLRDVFLGDVPQIFRHSNLYALCAVMGSLVYWLVAQLDVNRIWAVIACFVVTIGLRRLSLRFDIQTPDTIDLTDTVAHPLRHHRDTRDEKSD